MRAIAWCVVVSNMAIVLIAIFDGYIPVANRIEMIGVSLPIAVAATAILYMEMREVGR